MSMHKPLLYFGIACALTACESQSQIDTNFLGTPTAATTSFTQNFNLNSTTQANYSIGSAPIDFTTNSCELTSASQIDNATNAFAGGTLVGVAFDGTILKLNTTTNNAELDSSWTPEWSSLVGYWKMNEAGWNGTAGEVLDSSGNGNNGTAQAVLGSPTTTTGSAKLGSAAGVFRGLSSDDYIAVPVGGSTDLKNITNGNFTFAAWYRPSALPTNNGDTNTLASFIIGKRGYHSGLTYNPNGSFSLYLWANDTGSPYEEAAYSSKTYPIGSWYYVVGTYNVSTYTLNIYVNGDFAGTGAANPTSFTPFDYSTNPLQIGIGNPSIAPNVYSWPTQGNIDDVAVWKTVLSQNEIKTIYNRQSAQYSGTLTSRVVDSLASGSSWTNLSWVPTLPFFKELPDSFTTTPISEIASDYSSQTSNLMNGILGLWHLDEVTGASAMVDSSGNGNNSDSTSATFGSPGKFGASANFSTGTNIISAVSNLPVAATPRTVSFWMNTGSTGSASLFSYGTGAPGQLFEVDLFNSNHLIIHWWGGYAQGIIYSINTWSHIVAVYDGVNANLYQDGILTSTQAVSLNTGASSVTFGSGTLGSYAGNLDEVSLWSRALSANEVTELYRRGANRIKYQVQTCQHAADCTNSPNWQGPDGTNQTYFSELDNTTAYDKVNNVPSGSVNAGLPNMIFSNFAGTQPAANRYFQYRTILESDDTSTNCNYDGTGVPNTWCSPELKSTSVGPGHYGNSVNTVSNSTGQGYVTLSSFAETLGTGGCTTGVVYNLSKDNSTWYYWNGSAWTLANGSVVQANAATSINSNIATFPVQVGTGTLYFKAFLQSSGTSTCSLSGVSVGGTK